MARTLDRTKEKSPTYEQLFAEYIRFSQDIETSRRGGSPIEILAPYIFRRAQLIEDLLNFSET